MVISMRKNTQEGNNVTFREFIKHIRLVPGRSNKLTKIAVCLAITFSMLTLLVLHTFTLNAQAQADALREQAQQLEQENDRLDEKIDNLGSLESVEQIAKDELDLVDPDTVIIEPEQ